MTEFESKHGEQRMWREGKRGRRGEGGLSEGITGLLLNAKGPAGAQHGPTERRVGAP